MEIRRIDIRRRREPASCAAEIEFAQQAHKYRGPDDDDDAREIVSGACLITQHVPGFGQIVD